MTGAFCGLILYLKEFSGLLLVCCFCQVSFRYFLLYFENTNDLLHFNFYIDFLWKNNPHYFYFYQESTWPIVVVMLVPTKNSGSKLKQWLWKISSKFNCYVKIINYFQFKKNSSHFDKEKLLKSRIWCQICWGKSMFWVIT